MRKYSARARRIAPEAIFRCSAAALALFALFGFNPQTLAATDTWTGAGSGSTDWATTANWSYSTGTGPVATSDALVFTGTTSADTAGTNTLTDSLTTSTFNIAGITFTASAPAYTMTGNAFAITAGIVDDSTSTETINNSITLAATHSLNAAVSGADLVIGGALNGAGGITANGPGTVVLDAANTNTGTTTASAGTLQLNFAAGGAPTNNIIADTALSMGGGTLQIIGANGVANSQTFASTAITAGQSVISAAPSSGSTLPTVNLGALTVMSVAGASVEFVGPATIGASNVAVPATATITTTTAGLGTLGAYDNTANTGSSVEENGATVGLYDWASSDTTAGGAGTSPYTIIGGSQVTGFYQSTGLTTAGASYDYSPTGTNTLSGGSSDALVRFNYAGAGTISTTAATASGIIGFLITPNVGANNDTLSGSGLEFTRQTNAVQGWGTIVQNNTLGYFNVTLSLQPGREGSQDNGLVQDGPGTVVYTGANAYESATFLNGGYSVVIADNGFGNPADAGTTIHDDPVASDVFLNGGTAVGNATFTMDNNGANKRPFMLEAGGGGLAATAGFTMTIDGVVGSVGTSNLPLVIGIPASSANSNTAGLLPGSGAGTANTTAVMATGTVVLNAANSYYGGTTIDSGTLNINGINALGGADYGGTTLNGGTLQYATGATGNGSLDLTSIGTAGFGITSNGGTIDTNGNAVTYAGSIGNGGSGPLTVISTTSGGSLTLNGANTFTGALNLNSGSLTLGGANVNTGLTSVNGGTLTLASGGSLGNTAITVAAGATLKASSGNGGIGTGTGASLTLIGGASTTGSTFTMVGDSATGVLDLNGNLTIGGTAGAANLDFEVNSSSSDELVVSGGVLGGTGATAGDGKIFITSLGTTAPANGQTYTLISAASGLGTSLFTLGTQSFTYGTQAYTLTLSASTTTAEILTASYASLNYYWTGATNSWGTLSNFATDQTGATQQSSALSSTSNVFETATTAGNLAQNLNGSYTINSLSFTSSASPVSITGTGSNIMTIAAANSFTDSSSNSYGPGVGVVVQSGASAHIIYANVDLANSQTWQVNNSGSSPLTVNGVIADGGTLDSLTKAGVGTLVLNNAETYDGGTYVTGGTLRLGSAGSILTTGTLTVEGTGTFDLNGQSQSLNGLSGGGVATGTITDSAAAASTLTLTNSANDTYGGSITDNGATNSSSALSLVLNGSGSVTLSGASSFNGGTTVNNGTLVVSNNSALGNSASATGGLALTSGTVEFTSASPNVAGLNVNPTITGAGTSIILGNASAGTATTLTVGAGGASITNGLSMQYAGVISDLSATNGAAVGNLTVTGGSYLLLSGANTFTGITTMTGAGSEIQIANSLALQDSTLNYSGAGTLFSFGSLSAATFGALSGSQNLALTSTTGPVALTLGGSNQSGTFSGNLSGGGGISKYGSGTQTFTDATYTGNTIVYDGTLDISGATDLVTHLELTGQDGTSTANITGGTVVSNSGLYVSSSTGGSGTIYGQPGILNISGGAQVTANADTSGRAIAYGNGGNRPAGAGSMTIGTSGDTTTLVTANGAFDLYYAVGGTGEVGTFTLNLNGGTLATQYFQKSSNNATNEADQTAFVDLNGGTLEALESDSSTPSVFLPALTGVTVNDEAGGAIINTNGFNDTIAAAIVHGAGTPDGGLTKNGAGSLTMSGANTYTGPTTVNAGTLIVSGALSATSAVNVNSAGTLQLAVTGSPLNTSASLTLTAGTLQLLASETDSVGSLTLGAGASNLTLGATGSIIKFADSSANTWSGTLTINDWNGSAAGGGSDEVFFGISADLTAAQLADITFINGSADGYGFTTDSAVQLANGELVAAAVPEPGTWGMLLAGAGLLCVWQRRRRVRSGAASREMVQA